MKFWEEIRLVRLDLTDWVLHWTRSNVVERPYIRPYEKLLGILKSGYIKATFAPRTSRYRSGKRPGVKGPYPAVCFSEQTLRDFVASQPLSDYYQPYAVALHKYALHEYGGRPVIYGSEAMLGKMLEPGKPGYVDGREIYSGGLPEKYQYLWVGYNPIPQEDGYPIDWTHEREWRCRAKEGYDIDGVPLFLPSVVVRNKLTRFPPWVIVPNEEKAQSLANTIKESLDQWVSECTDDYIKHRLPELTKVRIVSIEEVREHLNSGDYSWARLETIP